MEKYLLSLPNCFSIPLSKFRCNNMRIPVVRGRYNNIPRELRFCNLCNNDVIGDEFHILLECEHPMIKNLRVSTIPRYYYNKPSMYKFIRLFENMNLKTTLARKIGKFLKEILKYM